LMLQAPLEEGSRCQRSWRLPALHYREGTSWNVQRAFDAVYEALSVVRDAEVEPRRSEFLADRWVHIRPSGTEPIVRVIGEAPSAEAAEKLVRDCRKPVEALGR